jgi:hypothetical protein
VGYSLGGLIARDMLVNNYSVNGHSVRGSHLIRGLITLGTPNEGYAYLPTDESLLCKYLLRDMKGYWNAVTNTYAQGSLSPFLSSLNQRWGPTSYGGYWFAAAGTNCASPFRVGPPPSLVLQDIGCLHGPSDSLGRYTVPNNDAVVCRDSAVDSANSSTPPAGAPTYTEYPNYVHTKAWGFGTFFVMGCTSFSSSTLELFNPPVDPQDPNHLLQKIVSQINGNQN